MARMVNVDSTLLARQGQRPPSVGKHAPAFLTRHNRSLRVNIDRWPAIEG